MWETYASKVLTGGVPLQVAEDTGGYTAHGVDYASFKLFALSLLWRAGATSRKEFAAVRLGKHEDIIRRMLLTSDPGHPYQYGFAIAYPPDKKVKEIHDHVIPAPVLRRFGPHHMHVFALAGFVWYFFVSSQWRQLPTGLASLSEEGTLRLHNGGRVTLEFLHQYAKDVTAAEKLRGPNPRRERK